MSGEGNRDEIPSWWAENARIKTDLGLPRYEPSRFIDGQYTYPVIEELESRFGSEIRFVGENPIYPEDWQVRIDGKPVFSIGRHRDKNGNTVFEMETDEFYEEIERHFGGGTI